ncbi:amidohydrolase family protein [Halioxenophilus sp. WMMB6]|uniref:amidohydrolase family protein n=1 Tax=Halioxenophilus sp. WMMB6 TaxID=3073815 RepID=UPI00295EE210|nr:amidohydrolase family protein [Halioxenophilus sp. WMMB6]
MPAIKFLFRPLWLTLLLATLSACDSPKPATGPETTTNTISTTITVHEGTNIAVARNPVNGELVIAHQGALFLQTAAGEVQALTEWPDDAWEPDINSSGTALVYEGYRFGSFDLWQLPLDGSEPPTQLTQSEFDDREPQYSPDGNAVIFSSERGGSYDIWQLALSSGELQQLTHTQGESHSPSWSPSGEQFAYITDGRPTSSVYLAEADGSGQRALWQSDGKLSALSWSPDGQQLAIRTLDRDADGNALSALRLIDIATGDEHSITADDADVFPFRAQWSGNNSLLFTSDGLIKNWQAGSETTIPFALPITITHADYPRKQRDFDRTDAQPVLGYSYPALSPEGDRLAFGARGDLWLWQISSQTLTQLTDDAAADQSPSWSADGKTLAYVSDKNGRYQVWLYDLASAQAEPIDIDRSIVSFPALSPDGRQVAFFTDVPGDPILHVTGQLTVYDRASKTLTPLITPMPPDPLSWSADGKYLITTKLVPYNKRYREGLYDLAIIDVAANSLQLIRPTPHRSLKHASYSAGASAIAYSEDGTLHALPVDQAMQPVGEAKTVLDELADTPSWSQDGRYIAYQAGDKIMRLTIASGEIEEITPSLTWQRAVPKEKWVLRAGRLFTGTGEKVLTNQDIVIAGNRIESIGASDPATQLPVVDASDKTVIPGLFESHSHIGDHNLSEEQGRVWLAYGITSVRDPGSNPYLANERKEAWASGRRIGPRTFITGHNIDGNRIYYAVSEGIGSDAHLERALERSRLLNVDFIKTYVRLPNDQQRRVMEFAHAMGVPTTSHELLPAASMGVDGIEHFTGTSRRGYTTKISELGRTYQDVEDILVAANMAIVPTMVVPGVVLTFSEQDDLYGTDSFNAFYGPAQKANYQAFMSFFGPGAEGYVDNYGQLLTHLVARGALVGTGTDSPFTPFGTGLHAELRLYQRAGLKPWQILQAATLQSARIAQVEQDLGSIEVGKLADMVVVDGNPLADVAALSQISLTVKNGTAYPVAGLRAASLE